MARGDLFILSAPSGAGKTTLIQSLFANGLAEAGVAFSVSHTTRPPRPGEREGVDYHFVDEAAFHEMIAADRFLEWAEVHGHHYGTSLDQVLPRLERGIDVLLDIDVKGAEQVLARCPEACSVFVMPPSYEALCERLRQRGQDGPEEIARRLAVSLWEIRRYDRYQYVIINDDARLAAERLAAIVFDKRHRLARMRERIGEVLQDFERAC